ncbi:IS4 family transposase [Nodularia harveyana UHCC-0300]|uniref:IS4 family transposase n=1 Tax=Nodularia harveyana UHCC-0300 TaxID=2974287 RepID=A0ABU5UJQ5_9CYAN|nr:IS4 family transposase [Nodularia harveyana]MEA5583765.1 IS4 family transposase [Nodularia harveyana UHCC-0300]
MEKWIIEELERTELGDKRRTKRLIKIVTNLSNSPLASVPQASGTWSQAKATYDFWDSPYIKPSMIRQGHRDATVERMAKHQVVLAIQDTTELNYTSHKALSGKGYLDSKYGKGLKVHSVLTASTQGIPLGIIEQQVWSRIEEELGKAEQRKQKPTAEKESQRWLDALKKTDSIMPESVQVVTIADREADFYDLFACPRRQGSDFLIRGNQNRCLVGCEEHLWETLDSKESQGTMTVEVKRNPTRPSRIATLTIRYATITIEPPQNRSKKEQLSPIKLQAILVTEVDTPKEVEPISWLLLTTLEITNLEDVKKYVQWYCYRWLIERYHYVLKSGCGIEKLQLETAQRLEMALATYSIVAWRLLWLTYMARCSPSDSCEQVLESHEWQVLYATIHHEIYPDTSPPTLAEVVNWIARLGGFLGRKSDGYPGVKVLWRGLSRLHDIVQGWLVCQSLVVN